MDRRVAVYLTLSIYEDLWTKNCIFNKSNNYIFTVVSVPHNTSKELWTLTYAYDESLAVSHST
jgi:hypothetical protein